MTEAKKAPRKKRQLHRDPSSPAAVAEKLRGRHTDEWLRRLVVALTKKL